MSVFILKIIAVAAMVIDHAGYMLSFFDPQSQLFQMMRAVGRLAFPVFAFLIVNGFEKTSHRRSYAARLSLFALISQLPYTLAFVPENYLSQAFRGSDSFLKINAETLRLAPLMALALIIYFVLICRRKADKSFFYVLSALLLPLFGLKIHGYVLLNLDLNVFYTLAICLAVICVLDELIHRRKERSRTWLILSSLAVTAAAFYIIPFSDYGYRALVLIVPLYLARNSRHLQALLALFWGIWLYNYSLPLMLGVAAASLLILLYNGKRGPAFKLGFYLIYPVHLFILFCLVFLYNKPF